MDTPLTTERLAEERAFIQRYTDTLAARRVNYPASYNTPVELLPRKLGSVPISLPDPPAVQAASAGPSETKLDLTIKSLKPALTFSVTASPTDTVAELKRQVAASSSTAPVVDAQRLLIKGKALADNKLLKEYDIASGATIHLLLKAVPTAPAPVAAALNTMSASASAVPPTAVPDTSANPLLSTATNVSAGVKRTPSSDLARPVPAGAGHSRVPSLTITTDVNDRPGSPGSGVEVPLTVTDAPPLGPQAQISSAAFHQTIADPAFWQRIHALCVAEFAYENDADAAWEAFLVSMKGRLSAGEAAKIRDVVGVRGMGGA